MSIKIENLCFSYGAQNILDNITFSTQYGQFLSILGPNGVGKSTLFKCILGLLKPQSGKITVDGKDVHPMSAARLAKHIAYIPQSHNPAFNYSVLDMVLMGTASQLSNYSSPGKNQEKTALQALGKLGITYLKNRNYNNLSGGERQLVLIARALAQQAKILVMDEPSANLDFGNKIKVMQTVRALADDGYCIIQSTHDPEQAYLYSDKIIALHNGKILARGSPKDVLTSEIISKLYDVNVRVHSMDNDTVRIWVPDLK